MTTVEKPRSDGITPSGEPSDPIRAEFWTSGDGGAVLDRRTSSVDGVVLRAWEETPGLATSQGLALLAVGGYGRRELYPFSDIDLLILSQSAEPERPMGEAIAEFLRALWDAGLRVSQSVRTVKDCCELHNGNTELSISLLDQRCLTGDLTIYEKLAERFPRFLQSQRQPLLGHLCRMTRERHRQFQETIHHLEPNVKQAPGGIRDLNVLGWLAKLQAEAWEADPFWREASEQPRRFLQAVRCFLHYSAGRDNNLLSFDAQEEAVEAVFTRWPDAGAFMREYYRNARVTFNALLRALEMSEGQTSSLLAGFRDWRSRVSNAEFTVSRERILLKSPQHLEQDPELALRLFQFVGRHRLGLHREVERKLREFSQGLREAVSANPSRWPSLLEVLRTPHASFAVRWMNETGLLGAIFPEWTGVDCYVVRDFNHRYTVDEHTLIALEHLERLRDSQDEPLTRYRNLLGEIEQPEVLRLALLFHDTGKGGDLPGHSEESAKLAASALSRAGAAADLTDTVCFLVRHHLDLSSVMTGRDLDDHGTARDVAARVETIEKLKQLTLLTYADVSAVHPGAMTSWRLEQLWRLYVIAYNELTRELHTDRIRFPAAGEGQVEAFLKGLPTRYLRTHSAEQIEHHQELNRARRGDGVAIEIVKTGGGYQLTVLASDRLFLFASLAGVLASFGMNILKAEAFSNQQGVVVDTFAFADPQRTLELNPTEVDRLKDNIRGVVLGKKDVKQLLRQRPVPKPPSRGSRIRPSVSFNNEASESATLVEVVAEDRPGLLYDLAHDLSQSGCNIDLVLVDTEAHKAIDVFYVTARGGKLAAGHQGRLRDSLLAACAV